MSIHPNPPISSILSHLFIFPCTCHNKLFNQLPAFMVLTFQITTSLTFTCPWPWSLKERLMSCIIVAPLFLYEIKLSKRQITQECFLFNLLISHPSSKFNHTPCFCSLSGLNKSQSWNLSWLHFYRWKIDREIESRCHKSNTVEDLI